MRHTKPNGEFWCFGLPHQAAPSSLRSPGAQEAAPTLWEFAVPDDSRHAGHRRRAAFRRRQEAPRAPAFPCAAARAAGPCGQTGAASRAGERAGQEPVRPAAAQGQVFGAGRQPYAPHFVTVSSPSEPARHRR